MNEIWIEEGTGLDGLSSIASAQDIRREELRARLIEAINGRNGTHPFKEEIRALHPKEEIRALHREQRTARANLESKVLQSDGPELLQYFANAAEICPHAIRPRLVLVERPDSIEGHLFRAATLLWSVPVSRGYGRRLRYLVMDQSNGKLIGLIALGDPVFNLACRDQWVGWNVRQREERLSFMMDAYVLGAVPPYSMLLGGKLVAALVASREIRADFNRRYGRRPGIISERDKHPRLVLLTTTSAFGRSSVYNRLHLPGMVSFERVGLTGGWGHFMVGDELFRELRAVLREEESSYHNNYQYKQGPNWRLRAIREVARLLGVEGDLLRHGVKREVYAIPLAVNSRQILRGEAKQPRRANASAATIARAAIDRWVIPRSKRTADWQGWTRQHTWESFTRSGLTLPPYEAVVRA